MSTRMFLSLVLSAQLVALPLLAGAHAQDAGNVDPGATGAMGSKGLNDATEIGGERVPPMPADIPSYGAPSSAEVAPAQAAPAYAPPPAAAFDRRAYPSASECLTAAYAAGQPLRQCE